MPLKTEIRLQAWLPEYEKTLCLEGLSSTATPSEVDTDTPSEGDSLSSRSSDVRTLTPSSSSSNAAPMSGRSAVSLVLSPSSCSSDVSANFQFLDTFSNEDLLSGDNGPASACEFAHLPPAHRINQAARLGALDEVRKCLLSDIQPNTRDCAGWAPIHYAAAEGHLDVCALLLEANKGDVNVASPDHSTPLMLAAEEGHLHVVRLLLSFLDADLHLRRKDDDGFTALDRCADSIREDFESLLTQC